MSNAAPPIPPAPYRVVPRYGRDGFRYYGLVGPDDAVVETVDSEYRRAVLEYRAGLLNRAYAAGFEAGRSSEPG